MIKLNFRVNRYCLAYLLINKLNQLTESSNKDVSLNTLTKNLQKKLFVKYRNDAAYYFVYLPEFKYVQWAADTIYLNKNDDSTKKNIKHLSYEIEDIFKTIFRSQEFKIILKQTFQYNNLVKKAWNQNKSFISKYLKEIIGAELPNISVTVNIVHPSFKIGRAIRDKNLIIWGHFDDWQNYTIVYLTHELLHILFNYYHIKPNELSHALIELIADNELRVRLNQGEKYFKENKMVIGHPYLKELEKNILPYWLKYLKKPDKEKNLIIFFNQLEKYKRSLS